jgi:hypothetical protein
MSDAENEDELLSLYKELIALPKDHVHAEVSAEMKEKSRLCNEMIVGQALWALADAKEHPVDTP